MQWGVPPQKKSLFKKNPRCDSTPSVCSKEMQKKKKKMRLPSSQERKKPVNIITVLEIDVQK